MAKAKSKAGPHSRFLGRWKLASMSTWEEIDVRDEPFAFIEFERDGLGQFEFGDVGGDIDFRDSTRDGKPAVEFTWEGGDYVEPLSGRGWAVLDGDRLDGTMFIHLGEATEFSAVRATEEDLVADIVPMVPGGKASPKKKKGTGGTGKVYQLKIALKDIRPPIWRRVIVPDCTLPFLHDVIQFAMGWQDSHLHEFEFGGVHYSDPETAAELEWEDSEDVMLGALVPGEKFKFRYTYDFGDTWIHEVLVEKVIDPEPGREYPVCLAGKRACPPEDVGGPWSYPDFADAIVDPAHEEHARWSEWIGEFDPEAFSVDEVNDKFRQFL
jgi:hypothetical protein